MDNSLIEAMNAEAARCYPNEACGVIVKSGSKKAELVPCRNVSESPRLHFLMHTQDYMKARSKGEVLSIWHSHVDTPPKPSEADLVGCEASDMTWLITGITRTADGFNFTAPEKVEPSGFEMPYVGRPYVSGILDCYSILMDFYKREFGIILNDYTRVEDDGSPIYGRFDERWLREGFVQLIDQKPQRGDVFLVQIAGATNHIGIYVSDDLMLHHMKNRLSKHDIYGGYWQKHTAKHLRHKSKC